MNVKKEVQFKIPPTQGLQIVSAHSYLAVIVFYQQRKNPVLSELATYRSVLKSCWVTVLREP